MSLITLICPNCNKSIHIDVENENHHIFCTFCGNKISTGNSLSLNSFEKNINNLLKSGFMSMEAFADSGIYSQNELNEALSSFKSVLKIDPDNIEAIIGMMCISTKESIPYYYKKIYSAYPTLSVFEKEHINKYSVKMFLSAYTEVKDYQRIDAVLSMFPKQISDVLNYDNKISIDKAKLLIKYGCSPDEIFWQTYMKMQVDVLEYLFNCGLNPNSSNPKLLEKSIYVIYREPTCPNSIRDIPILGNLIFYVLLILGISDRRRKVQVEQFPLVAFIQSGYNMNSGLLDLAECCLSHGADPNPFSFLYNKNDASWSCDRLINHIVDMPTARLLEKYGVKLTKKHIKRIEMYEKRKTD